MTRPITEVLSVGNVMAAYERLAITAVAEEWCSIEPGERCACAAGAVALDLGMSYEDLRSMAKTPEGPSRVVADRLGLHHSELVAFAEGFDDGPGCRRQHWRLAMVREVEVAYQHGKNVREALGDRVRS